MSKILMLVEGARTDVRLMDKLLDMYGISDDHELVSYNTNIYELYGQMFANLFKSTVQKCFFLHGLLPRSVQKETVIKAYEESKEA